MTGPRHPGWAPAANSLLKAGKQPEQELELLPPVARRQGWQEPVVPQLPWRHRQVCGEMHACMTAILRQLFPGTAQPSNSGSWSHPRTSRPHGHLTWICVTMGTSPCPKEKADNLRPFVKKCLQSTRWALRLAPPPSLQCWQAAGHQQRKEKSHLAVLILAALCLTGRISWHDL